MDSENGHGMMRVGRWAGGGCGRRQLRPRIPAGVPRRWRGLSPRRPLHARSAPAVRQGDPISRIAPLALGLAETRGGGVPVAPGPGDSGRDPSPHRDGVRDSARGRGGARQRGSGGHLHRRRATNLLSSAGALPTLAKLPERSRASDSQRATGRRRK